MKTLTGTVVEHVINLNRILKTGQQERFSVYMIMNIVYPSGKKSPEAKYIFGDSYRLEQNKRYTFAYNNEYSLKCSEKKWNNPAKLENKGKKDFEDVRLSLSMLNCAFIEPINKDDIIEQAPLETLKDEYDEFDELYNLTNKEEINLGTTF